MEHGYQLKPSRQFGWVARCRCGRYVTASYSKDRARAYIERHLADPRGADR